MDGLDECGTPVVQCKVLDVILLHFQKYHLPILILIASRSERHLTQPFNTGSLPEFYATLALDDAYQPNDDVRLFLSDNFMIIEALIMAQQGSTAQINVGNTSKSIGYKLFLTLILFNNRKPGENS